MYTQLADLSTVITLTVVGLYVCICIYIYIYIYMYICMCGCLMIVNAQRLQMIEARECVILFHFYRWSARFRALVAAWIRSNVMNR